MGCSGFFVRDDLAFPNHAMFVLIRLSEAPTIDLGASAEPPIWIRQTLRPLLERERFVWQELEQRPCLHPERK